MRDVQVARALLEIGAVGFSPRQPITFKSGLVSPIYVDNRRLPFHPAQWQVIIDGFSDLLSEQSIPCDVIAGVEAAGIPHSAALGYAMHIPSVFVRKQIKDHGTRSRIEGGSVAGKRVLLIEDLVTTGSSSLSSIAALRDEGAIVDHCLVIVTYGFPDALAAFAAANVQLNPLTIFGVILEQARQMGRFDAGDLSIIEDWLHDPQPWAARHGFA